MKLIGSLTSPYVRKVRIVLAEKKLDFHFELEDVWARDSILASNPLGKVPCLVMEGGEAVFDSRVIVEYVDTLSPVGRLIPERGRERAEVRTWEALADGVLDAGVAARLERTWAGRSDSERSQLPGSSGKCPRCIWCSRPCPRAWPTSLFAAVCISACLTWP
jgi:glutathione S-transferase